MSCIPILLFSFIFFIFGIFFYANYVESLFGMNNEEKTPAYTKYDGVDFVPAKNWIILFGHHFSSIAGAAPIVGPVIAVSIWGWGPTLLWIVLGAVFIGGLHDLSALCISIKKEGNSVGDIAKDVVSYKAKIIFSLFILSTLILIVAVFTYLCAETFIADPHIVLPSVGLIPVAILSGLLIYRFQKSQTIATVLALFLLLGLIIAGRSFPIRISNDINIWIFLLLVYAFFASITPVHILLQPRDYISSFLLFFGIGIGYISLLLSHPSVYIPFHISNNNGQTSIWPFLFITVACGAVSGFHGLIASGTTSKQLAKQSHAKRIGYGAMIFESALAVLAVLCVCSGLKDYETLKQVIDKGGPILAFSKGFGNISSAILGGYGATIAVIILNAFILTTLDTATRICRYVFSELVGVENRFFSASVVVILSGLISFGGKWRLIWPTFGASNQLIAAFTLLIVTSWLLINGRSALVTFVASIFMLATTICALLFQIITYFKKAQFFLFFISLFLIVIAVFMFLETIASLKRSCKKGYRIKL